MSTASSIEKKDVSPTSRVSRLDGGSIQKYVYDAVVLKPVVFYLTASSIQEAERRLRRMLKDHNTADSIKTGDKQEGVWTLLSLQKR